MPYATLRSPVGVNWWDVTDEQYPMNRAGGPVPVASSLSGERLGWKTRLADPAAN